MRPLHPWLLIGALMLPAMSGRPTADTPPDAALVRLQVMTAAGNTDGTAVLIRREDRAGDVVLHFLTSSHLFRDDEGDRLATGARVRVGARWVAVTPADVLMPVNTTVDVAVVRVAATTSALAPRPLVFEALTVGDVFAITGFDRNGNPATLAQRVRFRSTLLTVGDRDASSLAGCLGAPATSERGVFGVVSECTPGRAPTIALLGMARSFLQRYAAHPPISTRE